MREAGIEGEDAREHRIDRMREAGRERARELEARLEDRIDQLPDRIDERAVRGLNWFFGGIFVLCVVLVIVGISTGVLTSLTDLRAFVERLGPAGPVVYVGLVAMQCVFPVIPGGIGIVAGPVLFGPLLGFLYNYVAISLGSIAAFAIARHTGMTLVWKLFPDRLVDKFMAWTAKENFTRLFALAILLPVAPDDLLCYLAGTTKMRARTYVLIIVTCKPWAIAAYSFGLMALLETIAGWLG